jgi:heptosyltransferase-2/heptosyltransferase-3
LGLAGSAERLLVGQPGVGSVFGIGGRTRPYWLSPTQWRVLRLLRERGVGPVWVSDAKEAKTLSLLERAGYDPGLICRANDYPRQAGEHFADRWLRFAAATPRALAGSVAPVPLTVQPLCHLIVSAAMRADLDAWLRAIGLARRPLLLIQTGNWRTMRRWPPRHGSGGKFWPLGRWAAVLCALRTLHPHHSLLLLGVPREASLNAQLMQLAGVADTFNVAPDLPVPRLLALAERAAGIICVDSGPAHAAVAVGCPAVVLFGKADVTLYAPRGPDAVVRTLSATIGGEPSVLGITSDQVISAWREVFAESQLQRMRANDQPASVAFQYR